MTKPKQGSWLDEIAESRKTRAPSGSKRFTYEKDVANLRTPEKVLTPFNKKTPVKTPKPDSLPKNLNGTTDLAQLRAEQKLLANKPKR